MKLKKRYLPFCGLVVAGIATTVLFQNCSNPEFAAMNELASAKVEEIVPPVRVENDTYNVGAAPASVTHKQQEQEDIITPRLVLSAAPNGPAQSIFKPGQTVYARAYGLGANKANLILLMAETVDCPPGSAAEYQAALAGRYSASYSDHCLGVAYKDPERPDLPEDKKTSYAFSRYKNMVYKPANRTWNFEMKFAYDMALKVQLHDATARSLKVFVPPGQGVRIATVENTVVIRSDEPQILLTAKRLAAPDSDTYGQTAEVFDYKVPTATAWLVPGTLFNFLVTKIPANGILTYCTEIAGTNDCQSRSNWVYSSEGSTITQNGLSQTVTLTKLPQMSAEYYCSHYTLRFPINTTVNFYVEETVSGIKLQRSIPFGRPIANCTPSATSIYSPSGPVSFGRK